jgi:diguanylate cyclase (GGDEF)-like protein/PAS domain S-box-containing protein
MKQRSLLTIVGLGLVSLIVVVAWLLKLGYDESIRSTQVHADNLVQALHGQVVATFRRAQADAENIAERLRFSDLELKAVPARRAEVESLLRTQMRRFPEMGDYFVWDTEGNLLYSTSRSQSPSRPLSIASNPTFKLIRDDPTMSLVFSDVLRGSSSGRLMLGIGVPVRDAGGKFRGLVTGTIWLEQLATDIERLQVPDHSTIIIRRSDSHQLVFRRPFLEPLLNKPIRSPIQERIDSGELGGRARFPSAVDGEKRLHAFRKIQPYPFYIVVGLAEDEALREWRQNAWIVLTILVLMSSAVAVMLWRAMRADEARLVALSDTKNAFELLQEAIDAMSAGLIIYDPSDRMVMCNRAHRNLLGAINDVLVEGSTFEEIIREGARRGVFLNEFASEEEWVQHRLMLHKQADGRVHELELSEGRWVQISEHRTPKGYWVGSRIDITDRKRLEVELRAQASTDVLTGLANRRYFLTRLDQELERVRRQTTREAMVLMLDLDHFKRINDLYGHASGDGVLRHFADILRDELRAIDTAGRLGGEEFAVILPGSSRQAAQACAQRICDRVAARPLKFAGHELCVTVSVGLSALLPEDLTSDAVLTRADRALYRAKEGGRNCVALDEAAEDMPG